MFVRNSAHMGPYKFNHYSISYASRKKIQDRTYFQVKSRCRINEDKWTDQIYGGNKI